MIWNVEVSGQAEDDLKDLDPPVRRRVESAIDRYAETEQGDMRLLQGGNGEWRLRVSNWRAIMTFDNAAKIMRILRVRHRREAYRR